MLAVADACYRYATMLLRELATLMPLRYIADMRYYRLVVERFAAASAFFFATYMLRH